MDCFGMVGLCDLTCSVGAWRKAVIKFLIQGEHIEKALPKRRNKEIKRLSRVATLFPNKASLLRLVSAVLLEISEEWETEVYLRMGNSGLITQQELIYRNKVASPPIKTRRRNPAARNCP
jgi:hypothetical protein